MTLESNFWQTVKDNLSPFGILRRIENSAGLGTPDVVYCLTRMKEGSIPATGFIELKVAEYPARSSTPLRPRHLSKDQVDFAADWVKAGGRVSLLLRAAPWYFLFDAAETRALYEGLVPAAIAPVVASAAGTGRFPTGAILRELTK